MPRGKTATIAKGPLGTTPPPEPSVPDAVAEPLPKMEAPDQFIVPSSKLGPRVTRTAPEGEEWTRVISVYRKDECFHTGMEKIGDREIETNVRRPGIEMGAPKKPEDREHIMGTIKRAMGFRWDQSNDQVFGGDYWKYLVCGENGGVVTCTSPEGTFEMKGTDVRMAWNERAISLAADARSRGIDYLTPENIKREENAEMLIYEAYYRKVG